MKLPVRTVLVPMKAGTVVLSPGSQLHASSWRGIEGVTDLVAPNLFHMGGISKAMISFPQAKVWGVEGARALRPHIQWQKILGSDEWPYQQELQAVPIRGMPKVNEWVFYHVESKSLILTDLCFHLLNQRGLGARIILGMFGTYNRLGISHFFLRYVKDRKAFQDSVHQLLDFDFQQLVVSHGTNITVNAKDLLRAALLERDI